MAKRLFIPLILSAFLLSSVTALAENPPVPQSKKQALNALEKKLEAQKNAEAELAAREKQLQKDFNDLQKGLVKSAKKVRGQEDILTGIEDDLADLHRQEKERTKNLAEEQAALAELVVALERLARLPPEALLARPDEPIKAARGTMLIRSALPRIQEKAKALQTELDALELLRKELTVRLADEKETRDRLRQEEAELNKLMDKRRSYLTQTADRRARQTAEVQSLAKQAKNMRDLIQKIENEAATQASLTSAPSAKPPAPPRSGSMMLPAAGDIRTDYGQMDDLGAQSRGITISGHPGGTVISPMAGRIRFAGPFQNYRQILIVDHGGGYHSLIAGLSRIDTAVGENVAAGEPIGKLGSTASDTRLYFELRRNGKPVNPAPVLAAKKK